MASTTAIRIASRTYDGTLPILRGQMQVPGFDLHITETSDVAGMFAGMFKGQYDVGEMSLGELIYYTSRAKADLSAFQSSLPGCFGTVLFFAAALRA